MTLLVIVLFLLFSSLLVSLTLTNDAVAIPPKKINLDPLGIAFW